MKSFNKIQLFISYEAVNIMSTHCTKNLKTFSQRFFTSYEEFNILQYKPCKNQNCSPRTNFYLF